MKFTHEERDDLAEKLLFGIDTPQAIAEAWNVEIERRKAQLDTGEVESYPAEEVIAELRATVL